MRVESSSPHVPMSCGARRDLALESDLNTAIAHCVMTVLSFHRPAILKRALASIELSFVLSIAAVVDHNISTAYRASCRVGRRSSRTKPSRRHT